MLKKILNLFRSKDAVHLKPISKSKIIKKKSNKKISLKTNKSRKSNPNLNAVSKGNYKIQNDKTSIDNFVKDIHFFLINK